MAPAEDHRPPGGPPTPDHPAPEAHHDPDRRASLGALASGVAHAVNNPLASVASALRFLEEELERIAADPARLPAQLPQLRQALADATRGAERVRDLIRGLQPAETPGAAVTEDGTAPASPLRGRVLVVDDDPLVGRSMARLLHGQHEVTVLTSPAEALARLQGGERWDAILCDLMMPELSGMDVEERLLASAPDVVPRIVYLTGGAFTERARTFLAEGRPHLDKPVEARALRDRVAELVRRARGSD